MRSEFARMPVIPMPLMLIVPPPVNVAVVPFLITPPVRFNVLLAATETFALLAKVSAPASVLVPVPTSATPGPLMLTASAVE